MAFNERNEVFLSNGRTLRAVDTARIEGEVALPAEGVSRVLTVRAWLTCQRVEVLDGQAQLGGTAYFCMIYMGSDNQPHALNTACAWQRTLDIEGLSPHMAATAGAAAYEAAASVESGTVQLSAIAEITLTACQQNDTAICRELGFRPDIEGQPAGDQLQVQTQMLDTRYTAARGSAVSTLTGDCMLPARMPDGQTVLDVQCTAQVQEAHATAGRAFVRGECQVWLTYVCTQGELNTAPLTQPFECTVELSRSEMDFDHAITQATVAVEQAAAALMPDAEGARRVVQLTLTLGTNVTCTLEAACSAVTDAFIPGWEVSLDHADLTLAGVPMTASTSETLRAPLTPPEGLPAIGRIVSSFATPATVQAQAMDGSVMVDYAVECRLIYLSSGENPALYGFSQMVPSSAQIACTGAKEGDDVSAIVCAGESAAVVVSDFEAEIRIPITIDIEVQPTSRISVVTGASLGEQVQEVQGLLMMICVLPGDTLWSICKRYGVSPETIQRLNPALDGDPVPGSRLILYRMLA
nr:DUF3794 domain-containing protein [bacterium]